MGNLAGSVIAGLERLAVTQGARAGELLTVLPWQRKFIRGMLAAETSALSVARGGGKTTLCSALAVAALAGPLRQPRGEVILVAASFDQAKIAFTHALAFLRPAIERSPRRWRVQDSANAARIEDRDTGCVLRCVGSDPRRAHGLAPVLVLADEPAQWPPGTAEAMVAALRTAMGKMTGSRMVALGTRPDSETHWFAKELAGAADYSQCHAAGENDPPFQRRTWKRANPGLDHMPDLERAIRKEAKLAARDPALLASFRALRLNLGTSDTERSELISADLWQQCEGTAERDGRPTWGIDLGTSAAMSAVAAFWPSGRLECLAAFPTTPSLEERGLRDGVGRLYADCAGRGELIQTGGAAVDVSGLLEAALARFGAPVRVVSDRWREAELRDALARAGIPRAALELRGMGFKDGAEDVRAFRRACAEGRVTPLPSLLLRSAMREARTTSDPAGNAKLSKGTEGGRRMRAKDDAAAASILAVSAGYRRPTRSSGAFLGAV